MAIESKDTNNSANFATSHIIEGVLRWCTVITGIEMLFAVKYRGKGELENGG